ncbi:MAG TPA: NAD kinase [Saprospiraceae bacterium]|nr:NAD kinase [Saprospiraceae bacterium]
MKVCLYGQKLNKEDLTHIMSFISHLKDHKVEIYVYEPFFELLPAETGSSFKDHLWSSHEELIKIKPNVLISFGGDGTILSSVHILRDSLIPVLGINMGRLGFLAGVDKKLSSDAVYQLVHGMYRIEERAMLRLDSNVPLFGNHPVALNDFTILKRDNSSMITIKTYLNGDFLNSYWADGLIVATPTGSTGYSLSCGGPIVFPESNNLVITPVAPHNLNVRPVVIPDNTVLSFEVEGRTDNFLCTMDSRYEVITSDYQLAIKRCEYNVRLVHLHPSNFLKTIHDKLNWGLDQRN